MPGAEGAIVLDASAAIAALVDSGTNGEWARARLEACDSIAAPHLLLVEVTHVLRRLEARGVVAPTVARSALSDALALPVELYPFDVLADKVWNLRATLSAYDACYVALAAELGVALVTTDQRLARWRVPGCARIR